MKQQLLFTHVDRVARRISRDRFLRRTGVAFLLAGAVAFGLWTVWTRTEADWLSRHSALLVSSSALLALLATLLLRARRFSRRAASRVIERRYPELNQRLLAAVEQHASVETGRFTFLQRRVIGEALQHARNNDWLDVVPSSRLATSAGIQLIGMILFAVSVAAFWLRPPIVADERHAPQHAASPAVAATDEFAVTVEPGDVEIERGSDLLVLARFAGKLPADVTLVAAGSTGQPLRVPLAKSLDDPLFGGRLSDVRADTSYRVEYDEQRTKDFRVTVFDYPAVERLDAIVRFPDYTGLPEETLEDTRRVSVVEGSTITLVCHANKPVASARLIDESREEEKQADASSAPDTRSVRGTALPEDAALEFDFADGRRDLLQFTLTPRQDRLFKLRLVDEQGRNNKFPEEVVIEVRPNRRPELKLAFPAKDLRVSPIEELSLEASVWDDFGVIRYGLIYDLAGEKKTLVIGESVAGREHRDVAHLLSLETLQAEPDQLLSYYFFADDYGPDGQTRRTYSDMYFAEVRHFEEIFREGQQPPGGASQQQAGGGGPQGQKIEELAKLQKQVVNATWNVIRRESPARTQRVRLYSETFADDVELIHESQQSVHDALRKLEEKLNDAKSRSLVAVAAEQMTAALEALSEAAGNGDVDRLTDALTAEQAAYQGLLKLRAREHKVAQRNSGGGGGDGGGGGRSQQQLNQLEISNKQNRYQTGRDASSQQSSPADREQLQVLNRLRELARRQQGLNEKLKELENALREAKSPAEQEEIRRRLKRLRDEQQEMLRDVDTLRNRMDRPVNQQRMAEDRRRLDQTRDRVLEASDALKRGQVSKALNSGTRAERDLSDMQENFRKRTARQFADEMTDLRDRSRELSDKQHELTDRLKSAGGAGRRSLRDSRDHRQIARGLDDQKQKLDDLFDRVRDVIRKAEVTEPLLSKKLYDTLRESRRDEPAENLEAASKLLDKGEIEPAGEREQQAARGIETVRSGIEQAAESVLGSETESLRRAQRDLDDLKRAVENELAQADRRSQSPAGENSRQTADRSPQASGGAGRKPREEGQPGGKQSRTGGQQSGNNPNRQEARGGSARPADSPSQPQQPEENPQNGGSQPNPTQSGGSSNKGQSPQTGSASGQSSSGSNSQGGKPGLRSENNSGGQNNSQSNSQGGDQSGGQQNSGNNAGGQQGGRGPLSSFLNQGGQSGGPGDHGGEMKPLTGDDFRQWSDRMRDVEEMVEDPQLRDEAARIRDRARSMRVEFKRHSKEPNWDLVRGTILEPLVELQRRLAEEIAARESPDALVPIDREPVPDRFSDIVEEYYERLGKGNGRDERIRR